MVLRIVAGLTSRSSCSARYREPTGSPLRMWCITVSARTVRSRSLSVRHPASAVPARAPIARTAENLRIAGGFVKGRRRPLEKNGACARMVSPVDRLQLGERPVDAADDRVRRETAGSAR